MFVVCKKEPPKIDVVLLLKPNQTKMKCHIKSNVNMNNKERITTGFFEPDNILTKENVNIPLSSAKNLEHNC